MNLKNHVIYRILTGMLLLMYFRLRKNLYRLVWKGSISQRFVRRLFLLSFRICTVDCVLYSDSSMECSPHSKFKSSSIIIEREDIAHLLVASISNNPSITLICWSRIDWNQLLQLVVGGFSSPLFCSRCEIHVRRNWWYHQELWSSGSV